MTYLLIAILGLTLFFGARYLAQTIKRSEPRLSRIEPAIPLICLGAMAAGLSIFVAASVASAWTMVH
jgi:hypothetical protein